MYQQLGTNEILYMKKKTSVYEKHGYIETRKTPFVFK